MRNFFLIVILSFYFLSSPCPAGEMYPDEISLENYLNDFNVQTLNTKKNEKFKRKGWEDFEKKETNSFKSGDFSLNMQSNKMRDSKYLIEGIEQKGSINYDKKHFGLSTGAYGSYIKDGLSGATRELFFTPKFKYNDHVSVELNNYLDTHGDYFSQELGLKYKTKYLKNGSIGVSGGTKFNKDSTRSEKFKFSTEFYLF